MDTIFIHDLEIQTIIGLYDWERTSPQPLILDLEITTDLSAPIQSDSLDSGIDYAQIVKDIEHISQEHKFLLLEPYAESIAQHILSNYDAHDVTIKVNKPQAIKQAGGVGIKIKRTRQQLVVVSIGSNLSRQKNIQSAIMALSQIFSDIKLSPVYETKSVGFDGKDFYNLVASFRTNLTPKQINTYLKQIEKANGRLHSDKPSSKKTSSKKQAKITKAARQFADRTLDIDLLLYGDSILYEQGLDVPRDEIINYAFVLKPLADLLPECLHPVLQLSYLDLWQAFKDKPEFKEIDIDLKSLD